ncbi:MAG: hypothetical protein GX275_07955 [Clostridiales bacterium]|nr:hypothetical protein [Clostridiales bacterium]
MKYIKAQDVLPEKIIKFIQEYVDGEYIYVPRKSENHKGWGENSCIKNILTIRNEVILYESFYSKA